MAKKEEMTKDEATLQAVQEVDTLVTNALGALEEFRKLDQKQIDYIVAKASLAALDQHGSLALSAVQETKRGVFEDKATKNLFACEHVINYMRDLKTVGVISDTEYNGIVEIAEPVGVVAGIVPVTNPTSTAIFKSLICLKTRNPIVFSFHPGAISCSAQAAKVVYDAAVAAGAPKNCIQWISKPSMAGTDALMNHDGVSTILATGGNAMVRAAYSCGKPALGVGAGNVPAYVEKTADVRQAVNDIVLSKAFDNGMICASEQAAIVDKEIYKEFVEEMKSFGVYVVNNKEKALLEKFMFGEDPKREDATLNANVAGQDASWIANQAGFEVPERCVILVAECKEVGPKEPLTREKLSPVLALLKSDSTEDGMSKAEAMVNFNGLGHSAAIHTKDKQLATEFGERVKAIRIIWNQPSTFGGIGNVYNAFIPSLTLGCGSYGHNSVAGNVGPLNLLNIKKVGRRKNNMQWFKVPPKIYFERDSIEYLKDMPDVFRVFIVTDKSMTRLGIVDRIQEQLRRRPGKVHVEVFDEVEPDPSLETVHIGVEMMRRFEPDTIIAIGGGSPMDAAKGMWMFYEHPDVNFDDMKQKFMDIRKRAFKYPSLGAKAQLVCIPTTAGTGSEVTPFAVITDKKENKKYPLADYAITPSVAIIDASLTYSLPANITADTGMDVLTHATEAFVSTLANDYTDGLCLQAIRIVFKYLPRAYMNPEDHEARDKMANASCMAGMAFANSFLGLNHSLAHKIGGEFHVPHGRANAILLPHVIRYNGQKPMKNAVWPKYNYYKADERYQEIAQILGLPASTPQEGVESYAKACDDLAKTLGIQMSFKAQGIEEKEWKDAEEKIAYLAYEDQCTPANPRLPMISDMIKILDDSFKG